MSEDLTTGAPTAGALTTGTLLGAGTAGLAGRCQQPQLDAELLLAYVLASPRVRLRSHPELPRTGAERDRYLQLIARRAAGEPLAYLTRQREFWSLTLEIDASVLVPRPETELLVERALALGPKSEAVVADLGTGCGAIALALAAERPAWRVLATDVAADALALARRNAARLGLKVEFLAGSWLAPLAGRRFHLLLSNPPYIASAEPELATPPLCFEPRAALSPGEDGVAALREIVRGAPSHLERGGWLLLEHGATQAQAVARELVVRGFGHVRSHRDLAGHERMTEGRWG